MSTIGRITSSSTTTKPCALKGGDLIKMFIAALMFLLLIDSGTAIQCYKCAVTVEKQYEGQDVVVTRMCSKFDESSDYVVDCPFSTMCLKTISTFFLQNGQKQETITRGCAQQKDTTQVFENRQWQQKHSVQEVYAEGCDEFKENNLAGSIKTHCYCRGNLCNSADRKSKLLSTSYIITLTVILIFNAMHWNAIR